MAGCSAVKHVPEGETLLKDVRLKSDDKHVKPNDYRLYIRQEPNAKWFSLVKVPLGIYNLSGSDSTRRWNRFVRRLGEAPVCHDTLLTSASQTALREAMKSRGYLHAAVEVEAVTRKSRTQLTYTLHPGVRYYLKKVAWQFDSDSIRQAVMADSAQTLLRKGMPLSIDLLSDERNRIVRTLRNKGYYRINKEYLSFTADTTRFDNAATLTVHFARPAGMDDGSDYETYRIRNIRLYEDVSDTSCHQSELGSFKFFHGEKIKLFRRVYSRHIFLRPDSLYREERVQQTYGALNALPAVNYSTIRFREIPADSLTGAKGAAMLDGEIHVRTHDPHSIGLELEGTNTSGDLGAAVVWTYSNHNFLGGSENLSLKLRGAYEAIRGLEGYSGQDYLEYSGEINLQFPTLRLPGISTDRRRQLKSTSGLSLLYDSQNRPEFHRRVLTANWGYKWSPILRPGIRHRFDLISLNYVFMPWISETFRNEYLEGDDPHYAILRYSYENLLIMNMAYTFTYNSLTGTSATAGLYQTDGYQVRAGIETAGNLLYGISKLTHAPREASGQYAFMGIAYSQYAKFDFDYAKSISFGDRNSVALHAALGLAIPYGNSSIIPYEKRYFSGGANSVRGWSVRQLGPGAYRGKDGHIDFINQTGNLRLDLSVEYRTRLFWKFHGAAFVDAGNVWNTRHYADQEGGQFHFNTFYKQIAVAYGLGIRFNLDYFVLRFDGGMKAIHPGFTDSRRHFPFLHPNFKRDFTFHFAVGLPF